MENNESILLGYKEIMEPFFVLLHDKNPDLKMSFHTSFEDFGEEYKEGKFAARAHKQAANPEFILQVSGDFQLPVELYEEKDLLCSSWRNNGYNGGMPADLSEQMRGTLPSDFDVIAIQGNPLDSTNMSTQRLSLYVIGGVAQEIEKDKKSTFGTR